ncbi:MAG: hypothetical protein P4L71_20005 [Acetobacteraceae bacterium]|nr:hypothetical protein [Acetobacteraceae bacterium]
MPTPDGAPAPGRKQVDWEAVEREYRAGQLSAREIGRIHGVSHTAINRRAKTEGWVQNLSGRVREAAEAKLVAAEVSSQVSAATTRETVETAAARVVQLVRSHRSDISALRAIVKRMVEGLARVAGGIPLQPGDDALLGSRQGAIDGSDKLASALQRMVALERQAFGLVDKDATEDRDEIRTIRRVIVRPGDSDPGGVPPAAGA